MGLIACLVKRGPEAAGSTVIPPNGPVCPGCGAQHRRERRRRADTRHRLAIPAEARAATDETPCVRCGMTYGEMWRARPPLPAKQVCPVDRRRAP